MTHLTLKRHHILFALQNFPLPLACCSLQLKNRWRHCSAAGRLPGSLLSGWAGTGEGWGGSSPSHLTCGGGRWDKHLDRVPLESQVSMLPRLELLSSVHARVCVRVRSPLCVMMAISMEEPDKKALE